MDHVLAICIIVWLYTNNVDDIVKAIQERKDRP